MHRPEDQARIEIDRQLKAAGWAVQDRDDLNLYADRGVAVRYFQLQGGLEADYLLFVDQKAVGVVEAKPAGSTLTGVEVQSRKYSKRLPDTISAPVQPLPFLYQSTGIETRFTNRLDPEPRSRDVFGFHRPDNFRKWIAGASRLAGAAESDAGIVTVQRRPGYEVGSANLRAGLQRMPALPAGDLWPAQIEAIKNLEQSLAENRVRALIQMATGSGKTYTAVTSIYRLIKHADARRVLFLVDRKNLGKQALKEFQGYETPEEHRTFTELYNVQHLTSNKVDDVSRVCISTIQRLYSILQGEEELDDEVEETSAGELAGSVIKEPVPVRYNPELPIEFFDVIFIDESHRSIYTLWKQVLDYFDAFLIGLTATPAKQTFGFFDQNLVMEYGHREAVADRVNVDFDVYRIRTKITEQGSTVESDYYVERRDKETRRKRWEKLDEDLEYEARTLDRDIVAPDQIRTIVSALHRTLLTEIFPDRTEVPKTLIFAKTDSHADDIVRIVREEFDKGNEFCQKITYRTTGKKPEDLISEFRNSYNPRIAVSVDMISTGTDIKPLEALVFMRDVKSRVLFEQMKGRGVRVINSDDLKAVTSDAEHKTRFVIIDAVGVTEREEFNDSPSLERDPHVPTKKLMRAVAAGSTDPDVVSTLAGRLARLDLRLADEDRARIRDVSGGDSLQQITGGMVRALDPDVQHERARDEFQLEPEAEPSDEQVAAVREELLGEAVRPLASNPPLRHLLLDIKRSKEQTIDVVSADELLDSGYDAEAKEKARELTGSFEEFLAEHRDEITALQLLLGSSSGRRPTHDDIRELADAIEAPPHEWTPERLWHAYETLDSSRVRGRPEQVLTNIVSLVRYAAHHEDVLEPFPERAHERFQAWLAEQETRGRSFTPEQRWWLEKIHEYIAANLEITRDDFEYAPFAQKGGLAAARRAFGEELDEVMEEMTGVVAA